MDSDNNFINKIILTVVITLSLICFSVVAILLQGLFDDNVNNDKIFEIIGPAFNTVIGAFVGLLGGLSLNRSKCKD